MGNGLKTLCRRAALNSLCRTVAAEEQHITFVAVRPGVVDTGMQDLLIATGVLASLSAKRQI